MLLMRHKQQRGQSSLHGMRSVTLLWLYLGAAVCFYDVSLLRIAWKAKSRQGYSRLHISSFLDSLQEKVNFKPKEEPRTESDLLIEYIDYKPWRGPKKQYLTTHYKLWKDSWQEKFRNETDDTIYLYSVPENRRDWDSTKVNELWMFPWLWTRIKVERLAWLQKQFDVSVETVSVQEHMEMDALFSEFDMPHRWGLLRMAELDTLNLLGLNLAFFFDLNGVKPTDLGLRPDITLRTCPVQFHNCISSSNDPRDTDHYAPPLRWDRSKSPEQAFDEIKNIYSSYPKRGLRWSYGWIDRGGWKPQSFSGKYFYAQADSLLYGFTDDIEMYLDTDRREVQLRTSSRLGQTDFDVQRIRYNQFVRMLQKKGGWDVHPMPKLRYNLQTPYRWTSIWMGKLGDSIERTTDTVLAKVTRSSDNEANKVSWNALLEGLDTKVMGPLQRQITSLEDYEWFRVLEKETETVKVDANVFVQQLEETFKNLKKEAASFLPMRESRKAVIPRSIDDNDLFEPQGTMNSEETPEDALRDLKKYRFNVPQALQQLQQGSTPDSPRDIKAGNRREVHVYNREDFKKFLDTKEVSIEERRGALRSFAPSSSSSTSSIISPSESSSTTLSASLKSSKSLHPASAVENIIDQYRDNEHNGRKPWLASPVRRHLVHSEGGEGGRGSSVKSQLGIKVDVTAWS